ncbi:hypothetical protein [Oryzibacter oryziterrae]|uniref:hypothetical protein n=1 Tax=Oryzibacter oryziterrae TaxID=2766474 RepID=UPI001F42BBCF|nr:hypothetical protein [Oryzibacter oryziterrae]
MADEVLPIKLKAGQGFADPFFTYTASGCGSAGASRVELVEAPKHGKVTFRYEDIVKQGKPCGGHTFRANVMHFKPDAGFKGTDRLVLKFGHFTDTDQMSMVWDKVTYDLSFQ